MVTKEEIVKAVNVHVSQVLLVAESSLPIGQFQAFRKYVLNEFGNSGIGKDLDRIFGNESQQAR